MGTCGSDELAGQGNRPPSSRPDPSPEPISEVLKDLLEELQSRKVPTRPPRDWIQIIVTALPGLAAVIALIYTWQSINATTNATNRQLQIAGQGQVTDRYNAAITNLGSPSVDVRLGGIYALQRIMQDSPRDQSTVVAVLCAFVRDHANAATAESARPSASLGTSPAPRQVPTDIGAAMTVVDTRNTAYDSLGTLGDFTNVDLSGMNLTAVTLVGAYLVGADLSGAILFGGYLADARLLGADLSGANLDNAYLGGAHLDYANLTRASLRDAILTHANLNLADLTHANLTHANLTGANLTGANLTGAKLTGAKLTGTKGISTGGGSP